MHIRTQSSVEEAAGPTLQDGRKMFSTWWAQKLSSASAIWDQNDLIKICTAIAFVKGKEAEKFSREQDISISDVNKTKFLRPRPK